MESIDIQQYDEGILSVDPMAHLYPGHTPYHYVMNNPLSFTDPTGMYVVRGNKVVRTSVHKARFTGVTSVAGMRIRYFSNDPSNSNTQWDYFTLGFGRAMSGGNRLVKKIPGVDPRYLSEVSAGRDCKLPRYSALLIFALDIVEASVTIKE
ncbi:MAG: hypothetical protein LAT68_17395 [Cyclobacteriaceae bacterium]|nr:hypothetical protein [Cyclobacteriaceae bacterium]